MFKIFFAVGVFLVSEGNNRIESFVNLNNSHAKRNIHQFTTMGVYLEVPPPSKLLRRTSVFGHVHMKE